MPGPARTTIRAGYDAIAFSGAGPEAKPESLTMGSGSSAQATACLGQREAPGEERAAGDRSLAADLAHGHQVVDRRDAARRYDGQSRAEHFGQKLDIGAGQ